MAPYRSPDAPAPAAPPAPRRVPPVLVGFSVDRGLIRVATRSADAVNVLDVPTIGAIAPRARVLVPDVRWCTPSVTADGWAVFTQDAARLRVTASSGGVSRRAAHVASASGFVLSAQQAAAEPIARALPLTLDHDPCVLVSSSTPTDASRGLRLRVLGPDLATDRTPGWYAPLSSRGLLAAGASVHGPVAVLASDRDDEVDVCGYASDASPPSRDHTLSLGRGQRFECAAAGASKVVVVSRGGDGLEVRTLARDLRSELNPVPIVARTGWRIGAVRCAYAHGPFVIAHAEHAPGSSESAVVVTTFDGRLTSSGRVPFPSVDALGVDGGDVVVGALVDGSSAPLLMVYKLRVRGQRYAPRGATFSPRAYAYLLESPACGTTAERQAVLADVARLVAFSLGVRAPTALRLRRGDRASDSAVLTIPGADAAQDVTIEIRVRADGTSAAAVRIGGAPRALPAERAPQRVDGLLARLLAAVRPDAFDADEGTRLELASAGAAIDAIVSAVFGQRCAR